MSELGFNQRGLRARCKPLSSFHSALPLVLSEAHGDNSVVPLSRCPYDEIVWAVASRRPLDPAYYYIVLLYLIA